LKSLRRLRIDMIKGCGGFVKEGTANRYQGTGRDKNEKEWIIPDLRLKNLYLSFSM